MGESLAVSTEFLAGLLIGTVFVFCAGLVILVTGRVPVRLQRAFRAVMPETHRPLFDALWPETAVPSFDYYEKRQTYLEKLFAAQIEELRKTCDEKEIVIALHHWEWALVNAHHMVSEGRLYGRFELVPWDLPSAEAISVHDRRWLRRKSPRAPVHKTNGNGSLPTG